MPHCLFASDLHGREDRYEKLAGAVERERPAAVFLGGDLLPAAFGAPGAFVETAIAPRLERLRARLGPAYPRVFVILGNDDRRIEEASVLEVEEAGLWEHVHGRRVAWEGWSVYGYAHVPPTPFLLKDWERYDVSRYVDPGCVSPEEGMRTVDVPEGELRWGTIGRDLEALAGTEPLDRSIFLFHTPPHDTRLDRAALDGRSVDHAPVDVHVGSVAVRRFIERRQPRVTLHGHVHESARLTGAWMDRIGEAVLLSAAHDGPELALVRFDPETPGEATRALI